MLEKLEAIKARFAELGVALSNPEIVSDNQKYKQLSKEYRHLEKIVNVRDQYAKILDDIEFNREVLNSDDEDDKFKYYCSICCKAFSCSQSLSQHKKTNVHKQAMFDNQIVYKFAIDNSEIKQREKSALLSTGWLSDNLIQSYLKLKLNNTYVLGNF